MEADLPYFTVEVQHVCTPSILSGQIFIFLVRYREFRHLRFLRWRFLKLRDDRGPLDDEKSIPPAAIKPMTFCLQRCLYSVLYWTKIKSAVYICSFVRKTIQVFKWIGSGKVFIHATIFHLVAYLKFIDRPVFYYLLNRPVRSYNNRL